MSWFDKTAEPEISAVGARDRQNASPLDIAGRVALLENELQDARREILALRFGLDSAIARQNATIDLYEQRIDLIYRRVVGELGKAFGHYPARIESEAAVDAALADLIAAGLRRPVQPSDLNVEAMISNELRPGRLSGPLTLYGFRLDRRRAVDLGASVRILPLGEHGPGAALYGPYKRLAPAMYSAKAEFAVSERPTDSARRRVAIDVYAPEIDVVLGSAGHEIAKNEKTFALSVDFDWSTAAARGPFEFRVHQESDFGLELAGITLKIGGKDGQ